MAVWSAQSARQAAINLRMWASHVAATLAAARAEDRPGWDEACRRQAAIRDLLSRYPERLSVAAVDDVAWELGVSRATLIGLSSAIG